MSRNQHIRTLLTNDLSIINFILKFYYISLSISNYSRVDYLTNLAEIFSYWLRGRVIAQAANKNRHFSTKLSRLSRSFSILSFIFWLWDCILSEMDFLLLCLFFLLLLLLLFLLLLIVTRRFFLLLTLILFNIFFRCLVLWCLFIRVRLIIIWRLLFNFFIVWDFFYGLICLFFIVIVIIIIVIITVVTIFWWNLSFTIFLIFG